MPASVSLALPASTVRAVLLLGLLVTHVGAQLLAQELPVGEVNFFEKHVRPVLIEHCYECHSTQADRHEGGLVLDSRQGWLVGGENGPAIVAGDVEGSLLIRALRYDDESSQMPPHGKLPQGTIERIEHWVKSGAVDPRVGKTVGEDRFKNPSDPIRGKEHWAFRPLRTDRPPTVREADWPLSSIDHFVLARIESAGLSHAKQADRRTLVRRLYFQIIGLPPTPEQANAFLSDSRPDAVTRLVDRLLASPQFGERWGRHWLDLARYADSNGLDENFLFREAWRYRNWVIGAWNADQGYDDFLLKQIAGDLLPHDSIEQRDAQRVAAGFLVVGPKVLLGNDSQNQRMEVADEQIDTIGRAVLGQTLGCARCHDHKFDPVPTADYYALAGIFTSTEVVEQRYMLGQQRVMERLVGLGSDGDQLDSDYERYWRERPALLEKQKRAKSALELLKKPDLTAFDALAGKHADSVSEFATDITRSEAERIDAQQQYLNDLNRQVGAPASIPPRAMIPGDVDKPADEAIRIAGQFDRLGQPVPRGVLQVLSDGSLDIEAGRSGRIELSRWLTETGTGAGDLAARVLANRVWHHLIGRGLVRTVDNFGRTGEAPTHPELLDHLAQRLIDADWSIKDLIRAIVTSRTFAMSSATDEKADAVDPANALMWRANRRRLSPEMLRDAMLLAAGELDGKSLDSTVWYLGDQATDVGNNQNRRRTDFPCRSVYLPVIRNDLPELFQAFDFADPHIATGLRPDTTVPLQGLYMLNDASVIKASTAISRRLLASGSDNDRVKRMFESIVGRSADRGDREAMLQFIRVTESELADGDAEARVRAWSLGCQALFASSRFQILE